MDDLVQLATIANVAQRRMVAEDQELMPVGDRTQGAPAPNTEWHSRR